MGRWKRMKRRWKRRLKKASRVAAAPVRIIKKVHPVALAYRAAPKKVRKFVRRAAPTVLKYAGSAAANVPGVGTAAGAALRGASAVAAGKKWDEVAKQAAIGAIPGGPLAQEAAAAGLAAMQRVARGERVDRALGRAAKGGVVSAAERLGGRAAGAAARGGLGFAEGIARGERADRALGRAAKQEAITQMGRTMRGTRATQALRSLDPVSMATRARGMSDPFGTVSSRLARQTIQRQPALAALPAATLARKLGLPIHAIRKAKQQRPGLRWRPLSRAAGALVRRYVPAARYLTRYDTGGLSVDGRSYTIEKDDTPGAVAKSLTGTAGRYTELFSSNPERSTVKTSYGRNFKFFPTGQVIKLPQSWWPEVIVATPDEDDDVTRAELVKSKATLIAWAKTSGASAVSLTDYGTRPEDLAPSWSGRDRVVLMAFVGQRGRGSSDGELRQLDVDELADWAEAAAAGAGIPLPPVALPPVAKPPVAMPPVAMPPVAMPPVAMPPVAMPPVAIPPVAIPPVAIPPVAIPPVAIPPVAMPPVAASTEEKTATDQIADAAPALAALALAALLL